MIRQTYHCPNCRARVSYGIKFCCNCGVHFQWVTPKMDKQLSSVSCSIHPVSAQNATVARLPRQEKLQRGHGCSGWDRPQAHNDEPSAAQPNQRPQYIAAGNKSIVQEKDLPVGSSTAPVKTAIIKLLEHFLDKQARCN
jgi:hypothetical protein